MNGELGPAPRPFHLKMWIGGFYEWSIDEENEDGWELFDALLE